MGQCFFGKTNHQSRRNFKRSIYPKSNNWFDFHNGKKHTAGSSETIAVVEDHIPVFVRGGAFIPMIKTIQNTSQYSLDNFDLHYYFDAKTTTSDGMLYDDDGVTPNTLEGEFELLKFNSSVKAKTLTITISSNSGKNKVSKKNISVIIHNIKAKKVTFNGIPIAFKTIKNNVEIPISCGKGPANEIKIELD